MSYLVLLVKIYKRQTQCKGILDPWDMAWYGMIGHLESSSEVIWHYHQKARLCQKVCKLLGSAGIESKNVIVPDNTLVPTANHIYIQVLNPDHPPPGLVPLLPQH